MSDFSYLTKILGQDFILSFVIKHSLVSKVFFPQGFKKKLKSWTWNKPNQLATRWIATLQTFFQANFFREICTHTHTHKYLWQTIISCSVSWVFWGNFVFLVTITLQIAQIEIANWKYGNTSILQKLPYIAKKVFMLKWCGFSANSKEKYNTKLQRKQFFYKSPSIRKSHMISL